MLYKCDNCKIVLEDEDLIDYEEPRPGAYGAPCYETFRVCPRCQSVPYRYEKPEETDDED